MIKAQFSGERVYSNSMEAFALCEKSSFGEKKGGKVEYSIVEALFLLNENKLHLFSKDKMISADEFIKKVKKFDKKIENKILVFTDLRKKGYTVKTALKYGAEFRVYDKGINPGKDHAKWILYTAKEHESLSWHDFAAKNRIAHSTKKNLLLAIVDEEGDIIYYKVAWIKP